MWLPRVFRCPGWAPLSPRAFGLSRLALPWGSLVRNKAYGSVHQAFPGKAEPWVQSLQGPYWPVASGGSLTAFCWLGASRRGPDSEKRARKDLVLG